jgi:putative heme transporter
MLGTHTTELTLPALDLRALARRAALPALLAVAAIAALLLARSHVHALADGVRRLLGVSPEWAMVAIAFECLSLAGYVGLLSLVAGRAAPRIGVRESAQITLAGAAATRLLPTAGAGGLALALWALRQAGLRSRAATRTLLAFLVVLYSVFLASIAISAAVLALGLVSSHGPVELSAIAAVAATLAIVACLAIASHRGARPGDDESRDPGGDTHGRRIGASARLVGDAVRDALALTRTGDPRLAGAIAYWALDAAVVWAMLHAFGSPPVLPVIVLAYFVGQVANTLPIPGSVSGGIAGVLIAFGVAPELALPAVLAYRTVAVWLPSPLAVASVPALRATIARWRREASPAPSVQSACAEMQTRETSGCLRAVAVTAS